MLERMRARDGFPTRLFVILDVFFSEITSIRFMFLNYRTFRIG